MDKHVNSENSLSTFRHFSLNMFKGLAWEETPERGTVISVWFFKILFVLAEVSIP